MSLQHVDLLKGCVRLQRQFDWFDKQLTWLQTSHTGWKKCWKRFVLSKWNSEWGWTATAGVTFLTGAVIEQTVSFHLGMDLIFTAMAFVPVFVLLPLERTRLLGPKAQWSWQQKSCAICVLDALMDVFVQRHGALAQPMLEQYKQLKNKGLSTYQAAMISHTLRENFNISKDDAIAYLSATCVEVEEHNETQMRTVSTPLLRL